MPPDAFFAGRGLDRADPVRGSPEAIAALAKRGDARELAWRDGLPAMDERGRLQWRPVADAPLFLGLDDGAPRFCSVVEPASLPLSVLPFIAQLDDGTRRCSPPR